MAAGHVSENAKIAIVALIVGLKCNLLGFCNTIIIETCKFCNSYKEAIVVYAAVIKKCNISLKIFKRL